MKPLLFLSCLILISSQFLSCKKDPANKEQEIPEIVIDSLKLYDLSTVIVYTSMKNVTDPVTEKGICWLKDPGPEIINDKKINSGTSMVFTDTVFSMTMGTTFHFRSYYISGGTVHYSQELLITTKNLTLNFEKTFFGTGDSPAIVAVEGNETDGFAVCYKMLKNLVTQTYVRIAKFDANGNMLWSRDYDDGKPKEPVQFRMVKDGYLVVSSYMLSGDIRVVLQKFDVNGNFVWEREIKKDVYQYYVRLAIRNNDYLLTVKAHNIIPPTSPGARLSLWDFVIDNNGTITTEQEYPNFTTLAYSHTIYRSMELPGNGYLGYSGNLTTIGCCGVELDVEATRFGSQNAIQWHKTYGGTGDQYIVKTVPAPDGNYVIGGIRYSVPNSYPMAWLFKINSDNGSIIWERTYQGTNPIFGMSFTELTQSGGSYYGAGVTNGSYMYIFRYDSIGTRYWVYLKDVQNGPITPYALFVTANKEYYVFGTKFNGGSNPYSTVMMKLKE